MLDSETKRKIDTLRSILVGKVPDPKSQIEQITTGMIYKFMFDMDQESIEFGGVASFFSGEFEKYAWSNLFDPKLSGVDRVQLYDEAIQKMYNNPSAPQLFRDIFKNTYLPFKDPSTLNMFVKELNDFHYSHSEKLGDAFEYLLSFMGSQGDAGQFRTPRHIIDFIVEIINPKKDETILDPACGTAGFLISSFKHIMRENGDRKAGDKLTADERKAVGNNLVGYDIDPNMTRISLVNMYLHQFASPLIHEYDTLSSEDRWDEYFDVILANPPFFSPKGGIKPHQRFGLQSTRAEILFLDYILQHLKPNGRAGIIVPEGVIFQNGTAYKTLRKKLVEDCLVGVISLPAGVFQPYSGVKTSILILDKELNQQSDNIFFAKVENDGFSLGAHRTPIEKNDLPNLVSTIQSQNKDELFSVSKTNIIGNSSVSLSQSNYQTIDETVSDYPMIKIGDLFTTSSGGTPKAKEQKYYKNGTIPWIRSGEVDGKLVLDSELKITELGLKESSAKLFPVNSVLVAMYGATAGKVGILGIEASTNQAVCAIFPNEKCLPKYLYHLLRSQEETLVGLSVGGAQPNISQTIIKDFEIPLPPIEVQQQIVDELEGYQKIIDGCRQVVENYKPTIDMDPSWEMVELKNIIKLSSGQGLTQKDFRKGAYEVYGGNGVIGHHNEYFLNDKTVVIGRVGVYCGTVHLTSEKCWITDNALFVKDLLKPVNLEYLAIVLRNLNLNQYAKVGGQPSISQGEILGLSIPFPEMEIQYEVVMNANHITSLVQQNDELIKIYTQKIQDRISKVWGVGVEPIRLSNEEIMEQIKSGVLVHPQNDKWHEFFKFLKSKIHHDIDVPNPLILGGSGANNFSKNQRLREHLKVAEQNDVLSEALEFLTKFSDSQWVKSDGNLDPNAPTSFH